MFKDVRNTIFFDMQRKKRPVFATRKREPRLNFLRLRPNTILRGNTLNLVSFCFTLNQNRDA